MQSLPGQWIVVRFLGLALLLVLSACGKGSVTAVRPEPCEIDNGGCGPHSTCVPAGESRECLCDEGFANDGGECVDVNECLIANAGCDRRSICSNTEGSFTCACPAGELGDGSWCGNPWSTVAAGAWQTCAIRPDGSLWCWGSAADGVLGNGATAGYFTSPVRVGGDADWEKVFAGVYSTCAQKTDGSLWCWGRGVYGIFGDGTTANSAVPVKTAPGHSFVAVALGLEHSCAIDADAALWCWGWGDDGELGDGHFPGPTEDCRKLVPQKLDGTWKSVASRDEHTCAIRSDDSLWCWGMNDFGQLGDGTTEPRAAPTQVGTDVDWTQVSVGAFNTCALKTDGSAWCWGRNARFDHPAGSESFEAEPIRIGAETSWTRLHASADLLCGERSGGSLWCVGSNEYGQLGAGAAVLQSADPMRVGSIEWSSVAVGQYHSCALRPEGVMQCWGLGAWGALGIGGTSPRSQRSPVAVP